MSAALRCARRRVDGEARVTAPPGTGTTVFFFAFVVFCFFSVRACSKPPMSTGGSIDPSPSYEPQYVPRRIDPTSFRALPGAGRGAASSSGDGGGVLNLIASVPNPNAACGGARREGACGGAACGGGG